MGASFDVTERRLAEDALRRSEMRLASGTDLAGLAYYEVDFRENTAVVDERFSEICGFSRDRDEPLGALEFWIEHLHPEDRQRVMDLRRDLHDGRIEEVSLQYRFLHPVQGEKWLEHRAHVTGRDDRGQALTTFGVIRDITEQKRHEEELRSLSQRLIRAHEEERAILARELHDDVTQRLAVLSIKAGRAELAGPGEAMGETMREIRETLTHLSEDIHALAYHLHPSVLEELGLVEALRAECERLGRMNGLAFSLDLDPLPDGMGRDESFCLFRVAQEALNNLIRHSGERSACITLRRVAGGVRLAVQDEGVGFHPGNPATSKSLGLASMRERLRLVAGTLEIRSAPGEGTSVVAWVPGHEASS
jgi:PAS domain S-box-containing protein